ARSYQRSLARGRRSTSLGCASLEVARHLPRARSLGGCTSLEGRPGPRRRSLAHFFGFSPPASFASFATAPEREDTLVPGRSWVCPSTTTRSPTATPPLRMATSPVVVVTTTGLTAAVSSAPT